MYSSSNESFHAVFGHSHQIIEFNDCKGLGSLQEGPLETKQKFVRRFKTFLTRKNNMSDCLEDTMNRLHMDSTPILRKYRPKPKREGKIREIVTTDDEMVDDFIIHD